jgi:hypothetical protein
MYDHDDLPEDYWPEERPKTWQFDADGQLVPPQSNTRYKPINLQTTQPSAEQVLEQELKRIRDEVDFMCIQGHTIKITDTLRDSAGQKYYAGLVDSIPNAAT